MKVVINACFGGFSYSDEALRELKARNPKAFVTDRDMSRKKDRTDPLLIELIEKWGSDRVSGAHAKLKIVEIPDGTQYDIKEFDGMESIHERHRSWG